MYDGILMGNGMADNPLRDLSAWRVTVPGVIGQPEYDNPKKLFYSYLIDIRRVDIMEGGVLTHWGRDKMTAFSQTTLSNAFFWMKILEFRL